MGQALKKDELEKIHRFWNAANYLSCGQIYLKENPLLFEPLTKEHIKPRLLGHFGTSPGLNLIYCHLNRLICKNACDVLYITGPGHGGPAILANVYMEGTYSEFYPEVTEDMYGMRHLFRQFSTPKGVPSHVSPQTPGSIHEGGELGYSLMHAYGAAFDNPDLLVACVIGDGEAETGPLEGAWKSNKFLNPQRDGAVLPILHLNGYKISGPTVLARISDQERLDLFRGHGYEPFVVKGDDPLDVHQQMAETLDKCYQTIKTIQKEAREHGFQKRAMWPMIILETPKGWTGPKVVDGLPVEGTFRSHQVPLANVRENPEHLKMLEAWLLSYEPHKNFDKQGRLHKELKELVPERHLRMGASSYANGGRRLVALDLPNWQTFGLDIQKPGEVLGEATKTLGNYLKQVFVQNNDESNFRLFCPDETNSNRLGACFSVTDRCSTASILPIDDHVKADGRVMEVLSEHLCQGWLEGYLLTGRHGLFPTYEAFVQVIDSMMNQHAKWLKTCREIPWRAPVASLNYLLTSHAWRNDHNGYSHQGPGFIDTVLNKKSSVVRCYLPPDANCLLSVMDHCLRSRDYINVVVAGKQPQLQWLSVKEAEEHCSRGASIWQFCSHNSMKKTDVVLACAGDVPTIETVAASCLLKKYAPMLQVRVVNVVDLMALRLPTDHTHGLDQATFENLFTRECPVIFAFHGYPRVINELVHSRYDEERFHVKGYQEEGTTTTPFDMVVLNGMSRYHIAIEALQRVPRVASHTEDVIQRFENCLAEHSNYIATYLEDMPEITSWRFSQEVQEPVTTGKWEVGQTD